MGLWKELQKNIMSKKYKDLAEYLWVTEVSISWWIRKDNIPRRHKKRIIERLEMHNDYSIELCDKIYNSILRL